MIRPFRPLKDSELSALRAKLSPAIERWASGWLRGSGIFVLRVIRTEPLLPESADGRWHVAGPVDEPTAAVWIDAAGTAAMAEALLGGAPPVAVDSGHPLLAQLVETAVQALVSNIGEGFDRNTAASFGSEPPDLRWFRPGHGNAMVAIGVGPTELLLFLDRRCIDALIGRSAARAVVKGRPLESRASAIRFRKVRLQVHLDETRLSLADIRALQPRDVVRFDHPITRPVPVYVQGGADLGACYLGRRGSNRAARLVHKEESIQ